MISKIIQDISYFQQYVDFPLMKSLGQDYIIIKCDRGSGTIDPKWEEHYKNSVSAKIGVAPYFWADPTYDALEQAKKWMTVINGKNISWIELDWEQWFSDWDLWLQWQSGSISKSKVPVVSSDKIFNHFKTIYEYIKANTKCNIVVYSAPWFLDSYCPQGYDYLEDKYTHWADYSLFNKVGVQKTWAELEIIVPTGKVIPTLPTTYPWDKVLMWQFSGDKFSAVGVYSDALKTRLSKLDLNVWVNKNITIEQFVSGSIIPPVEVDPMKDIFKKSYRFVNALNLPYVSQLGTGASEHNNDCGAACGCMFVGGYKDVIPTPDEFYNKTGMTGDVYLSGVQIINTLKQYGVNSTLYISNMQTLKDYISTGKPVISLILYGTLVDAKIVTGTFRGYHFVCPVGFDAKNIYVNDPLYGGEYLEVPIATFEKCWKDAGIDPAKNSAFVAIVADNPIGNIIPNPTYQKWMVTSSNGLNVRSSPSVINSPSNVIRVMKYNEKFDVISIANGWGKLVLGGYASMAYAKLVT